MAHEITNVVVDKISILSKENAPAVKDATFKLFKFFKKKMFSEEQKERIEKLIK